MENGTFRHILIWGVVLGLAAGSLPAREAPGGRLSVSIHESGSEALLPCRAWVSIAGKRFFQPETETCTPYARDRSFSCDGAFIIEVPASPKATIHIERGKEYRPVDEELVVQPNQTTNVDITLERWVNLCKEGWYSADMHCHFGLGDLRVLKQLALADDINFEPLLTLWNHQTKLPAVGSWPDWPGGSSIQADATHVVTFRNQEIERIGGEAFESTGALLMFGLTKPVEMPPGNSRYPCDAALGRAAKEASPDCVIDTDKPIWGENVVGVALGLFDSVQLCHNHYHREATAPIGWGMAGAEIEEEQKEGPSTTSLRDKLGTWPSHPNGPDRVLGGQDELFLRTNSTYYRFLNCGFRLAATGGSAMGVMPVPLGYSRTYAKLDGPLTEAGYLAAIHAGRTFATSGPMLILTADGLDCGSEIRCSANADKPIGIEAKLRSIHPIDSLEIISNGKVIKTINLKDRPSWPLLEESVVLAFEPHRSGWIAARAIFTGPDGHLRQAHTSPVYITVDGKPSASKTDAEFMIRWIDHLRQITEKTGRYKTSEERLQVQALYQQARQKYQNIARQAEELWPD